MGETKGPKEREIFVRSCLFEGRDYVIGVRMEGESEWRECAIGPVMSLQVADTVCGWLNGGGKDALIRIGRNLERDNRKEAVGR